jgi:DNA-binding MarR family transcriptional regulator
MKYDQHMASPTDLFNWVLALTDLLGKDMAIQFEQQGLTPARTHLLWELHQRGPVTQQTIAQALQVSPRNVTSLVDALVQSGHVRRDSHPADRRAFLITLTDDGSTATARMEREHAELAAELFGAVSPEDRAATARALGHASERLTELFETHYGRKDHHDHDDAPRSG